MNNLSLWQIGKEYQELFSNLYDHDTGVINEDIENKLNELAPTIEKKCISIASWIRKMESEKSELDKLSREVELRQGEYDHKIHKLKSYLESNMQRFGMKEISCPYFNVKLSNNPYSTEIIDEAEIPEEFTKEVTTVKKVVDKSLIKEAVLRTGYQVPGALVEQKTKLKIVINKI